MWCERSGRKPSWAERSGAVSGVGVQKNQVERSGKSSLRERSGKQAKFAAQNPLHHNTTQSKKQSFIIAPSPPTLVATYHELIRPERPCTINATWIVHNGEDTRGSKTGADFRLRPLPFLSLPLIPSPPFQVILLYMIFIRHYSQQNTTQIKERKERRDRQTDIYSSRTH